MTHLRLLARSAVFATITRALAVGALFSTLVVAGCGGGGDGDGGGGNGGGSPTLSLTASPSTITLGEDTTLTWNSSSGTSCTASGGWSGSKGASGSETVTPDTVGTVTYTITCSGGVYTDPAMASTTVTVEPPTAFSATALIADTAGTGALTTDANVANAWGLAFGPTTPLWVANNGTQTSTVYDGNGKRQPLASPLVVRLPEPTAGVPFGPTGIVFNGSSAFVVSGSGTPGPARFIFAGQGGAIAGWSPTVDPDDAVITFVADDGAEYTGLAIGETTNGNVLYAADFANGKVDVFNASYEKQPTSDTSFEFADPDLPEGYAPFGIQAIANGAGGATQVYVAYARRDAGGEEEVGEGLGIVNVFDANGEFIARVVSDGAELNAPWGIALAPSDFGSLGDTLLVGNFGDGRINAFDPESGELVGTIADAAGDPFEVPGLWGIAFGNDAHNQPHTTLFYAAGINGEVNGVVGRIDAGEPPVLNEPPVATITAPTGGNVSGTVTVTATATSNTNIANVEFFADTTSLGTVTTPPYSVDWDTTTVEDGPVELTARATDTSGNVGTSPAVTVTVANTAPPPATTLTELQTSIFTPICSVCHDGSAPPNGALPGSMDLRAGNAHDSLVNVQSQEVSGLMRVAPGDPENSYIIHKLEGRPGIVGARMPFGGPFLDDATIDQVRSWIEAGAQDN